MSLVDVIRHVGISPGSLQSWNRKDLQYLYSTCLLYKLIPRASQWGWDKEIFLHIRECPFFDRDNLPLRFNNCHCLRQEKRCRRLRQITAHRFSCVSQGQGTGYYCTCVCFCDFSLVSRDLKTNSQQKKLQNCGGFLLSQMWPRSIDRPLFWDRVRRYMYAVHFAISQYLLVNLSFWRNVSNKCSLSVLLPCYCFFSSRRRHCCSVLVFFLSHNAVTLRIHQFQWSTMFTLLSTIGWSQVRLYTNTGNLLSAKSHCYFSPQGNQIPHSGF